MGTLSRMISFTLVKDGEDGKPGKGLSYAGEWDKDTIYQTNEFFRPAVEYRENEKQDFEFFALITDKPCQGINPKEDVAVNGGNWKYITQFHFIFSKVLFSLYAQLGDAIFFENYQFSQHGTDKLGNPTNNYKEFNPDLSKSNFIPNLYIDFLNGFLFAQKAHIRGSISFDFMDFEQIEWGKDSMMLNLEKSMNWRGLFDYQSRRTYYLPTELKYAGVVVRIYTPFGTRSAAGANIRIEGDQYFANQDTGIEVNLSLNSYVIFHSLPYYDSEEGKTKVSWCYELINQDYGMLS